MLIASVLTLVAIGVVVVPLIRKSSATPAPAVWAAFAAAGVLVFGGAGLYLAWSSWDWQKAAAAGMPVVVAISAPTALAVRTAEAAGITLIAVARSDGFEIFTHPHRIKEEASLHVVAG